MSRGARWLAAGALIALAGCHPKVASTPANVTATPAPAKAVETKPAAPKEVTMSSGLKYEDLVVGSGDLAESGKSVSVHYTGWLTDGTKFDSSVDRGQPFTFRLGAGQVIRGWDEGVAGMRVGGKRKLTIPSELGYGDRGAAGVIPPGATLVFDVELLAVR
jgi:FKBP-type peptidyl-prolyl cis-trans isomerase FkpA